MSSKGNTLIKSPWDDPAIAVAETAIFLWQGFCDAVPATYDYKNATLKQQAEYEKHSDGMGQTGMAMSMALVASITEQEFSKWKDREFPGVYHYEIIEPLGTWIASTDILVDLQYSKSDAIDQVRTRYNELMAAWFATDKLTT